MGDNRYTYFIRSLAVLSVCFALVFSSFIITSQDVSAQSSDIEAVRNKLQQDLLQLEKEIAENEKLLEEQKGETGSLSKDINTLQLEIKNKKLAIQKKTSQINSLAEDIRRKNNAINDLQSELTREKQSLASVLRQQYTLESYSFVEFFMSGETVNEFFGDLASYRQINDSLTDSFNRLEEIKALTEEEQAELERKKEETADTKYALEIDKENVEAKEGETKELLAVSKDKEKDYSDVIADRKEQYQKVSSALFQLLGSGGDITFGQAYELAKQAGNRTGIDPAFILAILKQETNIGKNIGTCNRPGDTRTWTSIMPGPTDGSWRDDQSAYLALTSTLGISPDGQPLSCPLASGGWGGAMGLSQFIPATWGDYGGIVKNSSGTYYYDSGKDRIRNTLGTGIPSNPWNHLHAVTATSLYMKDLGASTGTYSAERNAACKYYSGRGCEVPGVKNAFYGNAVMEHKKAIQANIDILEKGY